jgi:hypothetical protein
MGPFHDRQGGRVARVGVLASADGLGAPRPSWEQLRGLAPRAEWLRATLALASGPTRYGVVRADGGEAPVVGFCGTGQSTPRLTSGVAGKNIASEETLESGCAACFSTALVRLDHESVLHRGPGGPRLTVLSECAC